MIITRQSQYSGKSNTMNLNITDSQWARYCAGTECIQNVFPNLTPDEREFIKTGITAQEWEELFGPSK